MLNYRRVHLKPMYFINQCHPNKFNKNIFLKRDVQPSHALSLSTLTCGDQKLTWGHLAVFLLLSQQENLTRTAQTLPISLGHSALTR